MTQARDLADGKFDTDTLVVSASNDRVGVNNASPDTTMKVNFSSASTAGFGINDTNSGNLGGMLQFYSGSDNGTLRANIMNANNDGAHFAVGNGSIVFTQNSYVAANALDDYEEGTFDPFSGIGSAFTNESHVARYVKVGRVVHVDLQVQWTATDNSGNSLQLKPPFTSSSSPSSTASSGAVFYSGGALFSGDPIVSHIGNNSNDISLFKGSGGGFASVARSDVNGTYDIRIAFTYEV